MCHNFCNTNAGGQRGNEAKLLTSFSFLVIIQKSFINRIIQAVIRIQNTQSVRYLPRTSVIGNIIRPHLLHRVGNRTEVLGKMWAAVVHALEDAVSVQSGCHRQLYGRRISVGVFRTAIV